MDRVSAGVEWSVNQFLLLATSFVALGDFQVFSAEFCSRAPRAAEFCTCFVKAWRELLLLVLVILVP